MESRKRTSRITDFFYPKRVRNNDSTEELVSECNDGNSNSIINEETRNSSDENEFDKDNDDELTSEPSVNEETQSYSEEEDLIPKDYEHNECINKEAGSSANTNEGSDKEPYLNSKKKYMFSMFKLDNRRLKGIDTVKNDLGKFRNIILEELRKNHSLTETTVDVSLDKCGVFNLIHFYHSTEKKDNATALKITNKKYPGDIRTGNILIFFRLKNTATPEAYFLCEGSGFTSILHYSDPKFRTQIAIHFIDGEKIKEVETYNIAGPDIVTNTIYKENTHIATQTASFLERAIAKVSGIIKSDSKLAQLLQKKNRKDVKINVGMNFVKIGKPLLLDTFSKVLELFSSVMNTDIEVPNSHILNALEYVRRVDDDIKRGQLNEIILGKAITVITEDQNTGNYYLSHRYIRDWMLSSDVKLYEVRKNDKDEEIQSWNSTPTLKTVTDAIHRHLPSDHTRTELLKNKSILLSYRRPGKDEIHPVQEYIHGMVEDDNGAYFKIGQKWFFLSSTFSEIIDRNFASLTRRWLNEKNILKLIKYPWKTTKCYFTISDAMRFFELSLEQATNVLDELTKKISLVDDSNKCVLTNTSSLLPASSKLYSDMGKKIKETRKKKTAKVIQSTASTVSTTKHSLEGGHDSNNGRKENKNETNLTQDGEEAKPAEVQNTLYDCISSTSPVTDEHVLEVLQETRPILKMKEGKYCVVNAVVTTPLMEQLKRIEPSLTETKLLPFLKCMSVLSEGEYNELFLLCEPNDKFITIPGDRILANKVELFDILIYDQENHITYLLHNKEGLKNLTRDVCAQIRNSSELLWHDYLRGKRTHLKLFGESAVNSKTSHSLYRQFVRDKLTSIGEEKFQKMFDEKAQIVYIYGFTFGKANKKPKLKFEFKPIDQKDINVSDNIMKSLQDLGFLSASGILSDLFIGMTQEKFVSMFTVRGIKTTEKRKIYTSLIKYGTCNLSTIAKLELLTLDGCFGRYQIGGERRFNLALLQLPNC